MLITFITIIAILMLSLLLQKHFRFPSSMWMMGLGYLVHEIAGNVVVMPINEQEFANLVLACIPILLMSDMMELNPKDFKKNGYSLFYVIVIGMIGSITLGYLMADIVFSDYNMNMGEKIFTFIACFATDPVATIAIFSMFVLPHGLRFIAEGESLGNDAIAVLLAVEFALPLIVLEFSPLEFTFITIGSILMILFLGMLMAYIGILLMGTKNNRIWDLSTWLIISLLSFSIGEYFYIIPNTLFHTHSHFHVSGIAVVIVTIMAMIIFTNKLRMKAENRLETDKAYLTNAGINKKVYSKIAIDKAMQRFIKNISSQEDHEYIKNQIQFLALVMNTLLFIYLGGIIAEDWNIMVKHWYAIVMMVIVSTFIRGVMFGGFAIISNKMTKMISIPFHWWMVLTFAGFQGGLSVVFMTMIPQDIVNAEVMRAVIIGNIVLSTIVNAVILLWYINKNSEKFQKEFELEHQH